VWYLKELATMWNWHITIRDKSNWRHTKTTCFRVFIIEMEQRKTLSFEIIDLTPAVREPR